MGLIKAEVAVAVAAKTGKTVSANVDTVSSGTIAYAADRSYFGKLTAVRDKADRSASLIVKYGLSSGAGQVAVHTLEFSKGQTVLVLDGVCFTSTVLKNCTLTFEGYKQTLS